MANPTDADALDVARDVEKRDYVKEAEPFQRVPFDQKPDLEDYQAEDRTPFMKQLPVEEWADAIEEPDDDQ